ncbi:methionine ABC transporter ATP-binding protein [Kineococcus rhizosphaerae]|uniref:ABC-type methionine transport system ATPase subunit n=1 Tax=Kineococcus rhizosphaerae TaxID=559628 RepID=A0A2T0R1G8_9ACTN|nr:ATP-binding cassette domain-containing protein [Kineococcus rhizosphaerae]PRY13409.1 ABC-type methionine transport system ATPase subunit [Kineococcus rhizosphaerae]
MIELRHLTKTYGDAPHVTTVLDRLDLTVPAGSITAVVGPSGAGKSTLAQCVTLLTRPTSGSVVVAGQDLTGLGESRLREARRRIGTIFQSDGLQTRRTAAQNVELPLRYLGVVPRDRRRRVAELLDRVGLAGFADRYPHELSGGQRQRVGIARALALRPTVLLADEATSGLDPQATASITALLRGLRDDLGLAILFITHEMDTIVDVADTVARLDHGRIVENAPLLDVLRDPGSPVGAALLPRRPVAASAGLVVWEVHYRGDDVPADWLTSASRELGHDLALLGASVGTVAGSTVGHATLGVPRALDAAALRAAFTRRGLHAQVAPTARELDLV